MSAPHWARWGGGVGGEHPGLGRRETLGSRLSRAHGAGDSRAGEGTPDISDTVAFPDTDLSGVSHSLLRRDRPQLRTAFPISRARTVTAVGTAGFLLSQ